MIGQILRKRLHRPEAIAQLAGDLWARRGPVHSNRIHLHEAADWILRAQGATGDDGVSGGYSFEDGWIASYPETTGYIIPTLLQFADYCGDPKYRRQALAMAEWELTVQLPEGGFPGHFVDSAHPPVVFNTGQVIFGLLAAYRTMGDSRFLAAAQQAGAWLVGVQDSDGAWRQFDYRDTLHVYNTRTAWALVELARRTDDEAMLRAADRHLAWARQQCQENGWFRNCAFGPGEDPFLHTIAYTVQGLLEAGVLLEQKAYVKTATRTARAVAKQVGADGFVAATFDRNWRATTRCSCLTGNAQMSVIWLRLYALIGDAELRDTALRVTTFLKSLQNCETPNPHIRGAIKGSHPIWGRYLFGTYPNWAAKFFIDALLIEEALHSGTPPNLVPW